MTDPQVEWKAVGDYGTEKPAAKSRIFTDGREQTR